MKKILLLFLLITPVFTALADETGSEVEQQNLPNTLLVTLNDGSAVEYALNELPEISFPAQIS